jgi:hypothetical protein
MKKFIVLIAAITAMTCHISAKNTELDCNQTSVVHSTTMQTDKEVDVAQPVKDSFLGLGIGYASGGYVPINFHYTHNKVYYGFSVSFPVSKGTEGERYKTINWDELSEDHVKEGSYYTPITFDFGCDFNSFTVGIGLGVAIGTKYRNCFDDFHILGDNGSYYKEVKEGISGEFKVFAKYRLQSRTGIHYYLGAQYTVKTGVGVTIGVDI